MKKIQSIQLFFQEGNSDKVYEIEILESGADNYVVNFRYGRRGSSLKEGTKTVFPVPFAEAQKIYNELEAEKRKKGYAAEGENAAFIKDITPRSKASSGEQKGKTILKFLKAAAAGNEHDTWPLTRIIWRAGELGLTDAVPYILKLSHTNDDMHAYTCARSLGRLGDVIAIPFFEELIKSSKKSHITNMAYAALLNCAEPHQLDTFTARLRELLPVSIKHIIANEAGIPENVISEMLENYGGGSREFLIHFYLVSIKHETLRKIVVKIISNLPLEPGYFKVIRQVFKISEMLADTEVYGILVNKIERTESTFEARDFNDESNNNIGDGTTNQAFSALTKGYFQRRIVRMLKRAGKDNSPYYTKYATGILLSFNDDENFIAPYKNVKSFFDYDSSTRQYTNTQTVTWFDAYAVHHSLYTILFTNSSRYTFIKNKWQCVAPFEPSKPYEPLREEAFAQLWNKAPGDIIKLLCESKCGWVNNFALQVFAGNAAFKDEVNNNHLVAFLNNSFLKVQQLAFNLIKERFETSNVPDEVLVALITCDLAEARQFANTRIENEALSYCNNSGFITKIVLSNRLTSHEWLNSFLLKHTANPQVLSAVLNEVIKALKNSGDFNEAYIESLIKLTETCFKTAAIFVNTELLFALLQNSSSHVQAYAAKLLVLRQLKPEEVPEILILNLLQSGHPQARAAAIDLLNQTNAAQLVNKQNLILSLCLSPMQDVRQAAQKLFDKLLSADSSSGYTFVNLFLPVLTVKEKFEGLHSDINDLITNKLHNYLDRIEVKKIITFCTSRYISAQELGNLLLRKNVNLHNLPVKDLNVLANSSLAETRQLIKDYYTNNVLHIKEDKKEAVLLTDSVWDDVRQFAFNYFKTNFEESDWSAEIFIALCDSTREDVQAFGRQMISTWFQKDKGFEYLLKLSQHPDTRMQLFVSGFLNDYAQNNSKMLEQLYDFFIRLLMQVNKGRTAKIRSIQLLTQEALQSEENAVLIATIFNKVSATASVQDKALYIQALLGIAKKFPNVEVVLKLRESVIYKQKTGAHVV